MDVFVARQPIFDRSGHLHAYELLFRSSDVHNSFDGSDAASATIQVIANSLLSLGLENILCGKKAFLNFDRSLLLGGVHSILPPETFVLEILESVEPDAEVIAACRDFRKQGYTIALDDFVDHPHFAPLTQIAQVIKVDMRRTTRPDQKRMVQTYQPRGIAMLAEKVETHEEFEWARRAGYDLFQGYFFARPALVRGKQVPAAKVNCLRLLHETQQTDLDFERIRTIISEDVALCYSLLRYINSALFAHQSEISSISQSLALLGENGIRHWAVLSALPQLAKDKPGELITQSLVRAKFCERLAQLVGVAEKHLGFLTGLLSLLDALLDVPLDEALRKAGVCPIISEALLGTARGKNSYENIYKLACAYEQADWAAASALTSDLGLKSFDIAKAYSESTLWAQQALQATARKSDARRSVRHRVDGILRIQWQDQLGRQKVASAKLINVSATGLQLQLSHQIHLHGAVSCYEPKIGISGIGSVRYCNLSAGKYLIGLDFVNGTGWREPS